MMIHLKRLAVGCAAILAVVMFVAFIMLLFVCPILWVAVFALPIAYLIGWRVQHFCDVELRVAPNWASRRINR